MAEIVLRISVVYNPDYITVPEVIENLDFIIYHRGHHALSEGIEELSSFEIAKLYESTYKIP